MGKTVSNEAINKAVDYIKTNLIGTRTRILVQNRDKLDFSFYSTLKTVMYDGIEIRVDGENYTGFIEGNAVTDIFYPNNISSPEVEFDCGEDKVTFIQA
ncbi:MAG: hypothetical protein J6M44_17370 [Butyrivibrio sp.]|uniref:hypothetical protein n=1 Tax=Butyrivibrio sp. TaxID=28121 RepID=UPI001B66EA20|nr:hypothetical protein [Butyrivibrio sp.]MBP3280719.1 hypothetical protein [Butyrivibrio sp.]MBP3782112.1 hypothetical protein [Butyrivibrio sp.]